MTVPTIYQHFVITDTRIVDLNTLDVVIFGIIRFQHGIGNVSVSVLELANEQKKTRISIRDVLASIALSRNVNISTFHIKRLHKVLPEAHKLSRNIALVVDLSRSTRCSRRETSTNGLIHPDHVCQVSPGVWVSDWFISSRLPQEGTVFIQESVQ